MKLTKIGQFIFPLVIKHTTLLVTKFSLTPKFIHFNKYIKILHYSPPPKPGSRCRALITFPLDAALTTLLYQIHLVLLYSIINSKFVWITYFRLNKINNEYKARPLFTISNKIFLNSQTDYHLKNQNIYDKKYKSCNEILWLLKYLIYKITSG